MDILKFQQSKYISLLLDIESHPGTKGALCGIKTTCDVTKVNRLNQLLEDGLIVCDLDSRIYRLTPAGEHVSLLLHAIEKVQTEPPKLSEPPARPEVDILRSRYNGMIARCYSETAHEYDRYGGRGIRVCDEWLDSFDVFAEWALSNGFKSALTLDRRDVDGDYCPANCRWADIDTQANNRSSNCLITCDGETLSVKKWSERLGRSYSTMLMQLHAGWPDERIIHPEKYPRGRPKAGTTMLTCPECSSDAVWASFTDSVYGTGHCRRCKFSWVMSAQDFDRFCTMKG